MVHSQLECIMILRCIRSVEIQDVEVKELSVPPKLKFVDLFSCGGGMSSGFIRQGSFQTIGAVDLEVAKPSHGIGATFCNDTYERNLGLRPMSADLAITTPDEVASHFGFTASDVDVLISCAPCTGFSQKQSRNHIKDDRRNQLVERAADFAEAWRPKYVVIENVKELLRGRHKHHFQALHERLAQLGYDVFAEIHDLKEFGLPQSRIRSLIVAKLNGTFHLELPRVNKHRTVRDAIGHLPALQAGATSQKDEMHTCPNLKGVSLERMKAIPRNGGSWIDLTEEQAHLRMDRLMSLPTILQFWKTARVRRRTSPLAFLVRTYQILRTDNAVWRTGCVSASPPFSCARLVNIKIAAISCGR